MKSRHRIASGTKGIMSRIGHSAGGALIHIGKNMMGLGGTTFGSGYEAAQRQRRLFGFRPSDAGINSLLIGAGQTLRSRARYLVRNNPYARKAQRVFVTNLVGEGIRPNLLLKDEKTKQAIVEKWDEWTDEADADGIVDFYGLQALAARCIFEAGECFIRFRSRRASDGLSVPLQMQLLESDFCPYELNSVASNGNIIRAGIEFNSIGQRVAYWFWKNHPGEYAMTSTDVGYTRVPASDVLHLFEPLRGGQVRGVSWLSAAIVRAWLIDQYDDAELERKKTAALFAGFITRPDNSTDDMPIPAQDQPAAGTADTSMNAPGEAIAGLTPGMLQVLLTGEDVKFSNPADVGPNYEAFEYRALLAMCAGMDMPYSSVTGDYTKANYSSERARQLDLRAAMRQLQRIVMMFQMCRPTMRRFVSDAILADALPIRASAFNANPRLYTRAKWIPPRVEWVNPMDDIQSDVIAMRSGVKSREEVALSRGMTLEELDAAIARSNASADAHGLVLDSDPRRTAQNGGTGGAGKTPAVSTEDDDIIENEDEVAA